MPQDEWFDKRMTWLAVLVVMGLEAAAIFNNAGYFLGYMTLCVVGFWLTLVVMLLWRQLPWRVPASLLVVIALLCLFWLWVGLSAFWSIGIDLSWNEFNRTGGYLAVFLVGLLVGRDRGARLISSGLFLGLLGLTAAYALSCKMLPSQVDNLEQAARIAIPVGYANALGLLLALSVPLALFVTANQKLHWGLRLAVLPLLPLFFICQFFIASRGAMLALLIGLTVYFMAAPVRLRAAGILGLALTAVAPLLWWSQGQNALMKGQIPLDERLIAAEPLRLFILAAFIGIAVIFMSALAVGRAFKFPLMATRVLGLLIGLTLAISLIVSVTAFVRSKSDFGQWSQEAYRNFTAKDPDRAGSLHLLALDASGRYQLWREALENWQEHPVRGTGGQTFPLVHLLRRDEGVPFVKQPHGLAFRLLAELGVVGLILLGSFIFLSLFLITRGLQRLRDRWEKGWASALLSLTVIYLIHASYDWDWNMLALTAPYFFFTGLLLGWLVVGKTVIVHDREPLAAAAG